MYDKSLIIILCCKQITKARIPSDKKIVSEYDQEIPQSQTADNKVSKGAKIRNRKSGFLA